MLFNTIFYILAFLLILTSLLIVLSKKVYASIILTIGFFLFSGVLFFAIAEYYNGIFQIFVLAILLGTILISCYKNTFKENDFSENIFKNPKFVYGIIFSLIIFFIIGLFVYYIKTHFAEENLIIYNNKILYKDFSSFYVVLKSIFNDYFLAFSYTILGFIITLGGVTLLVTKKSARQKVNEKKDD